MYVCVCACSMCVYTFVDKHVRSLDAIDINTYLHRYSSVTD